MDKSFAYDLLKERGIVSTRVDLCHDLLRLSLCSHDLLQNKLLPFSQGRGSHTTQSVLSNFSKHKKNIYISYPHLFTYLLHTTLTPHTHTHTDNRCWLRITRVDKLPTYPGRTYSEDQSTTNNRQKTTTLHIFTHCQT